jgi:hypothetical protein
MSEELENAVEALKNPTLFTDKREAVLVYRDDLTLVLDRLEELEGQVAALPEKVLDISSELAVGDEVVTLIDYKEARRGTTGKVVRLCPTYEYPVEVEFEGLSLFFLKDSVIGYKRDELGKVSG